MFNKIADGHAPYKNMCVRETNEKWITEDYISTAHDRDYFSTKFRDIHPVIQDPASTFS